MRLKEIEWVEYLKQTAGKNKEVITGIGDDCAQVKIDKKSVLLKSDLFVEDIHFRIGKMNYKTIGMRAVARVLSDFAACAGIPKYLGISAGVPRYVKEKCLKEILAGVIYCAKEYKFSLVAGDTSRAGNLFLDVWAVGYAKKCVLRSTAKEGDYIFVTGKLGARSFFEPFVPRINEAQWLVKNFKINAMIDISDGFIIDLYRILKDSGKGAVINFKDIPCGKTSDLYRGEDYELIFTVDKNDSGIERLNKKFYLVGRIEKAGYRMCKDGRMTNVKIRGYSHF